MKTELLKVNDSVDMLPSDPNTTEKRAYIIVRIFNADGKDMEALANSLRDNQCFLTGKNLLNDPLLKGKFDPKKVYVFETN
jgi:hypothetical protein